MAGNAALTHIPNRSVTHVMYQSEDDEGVTTLYGVALDPAFPELHLFPNSFVCSSSRGLLLIYDGSTHSHRLFNPTILQEGSVVEPLPLPQREHHASSCIAILATTPSSFYVVFLGLMGSFKKSKNDHAPECVTYRIDVFSSHNHRWSESLRKMSGTNHILESVYASCDRNVFLLVCTKTVPERAAFVISLDTETGAVHEINMPYDDVIIDPRRVQLGRIGEALGIVIVNDTTKMVEIYTLNRLTGGGHSWTLLCLVKVVLENGCSPELLYDLDGQPCTMKCSEMPKAIFEFESFMLQLPLMVAGKLIVLESGPDWSSLPTKNVGLLKLDAPEGIFQGCRWGLAHVASDIRLLYQILNYH